jgi:GntR family transcriptional regulator
MDAVAKCRDARRSLIAIRVRAALSEALHGGLTAEEIRQLLDAELSSLDGNVRTIASPALKNSSDNSSAKGTGT